MYAIIETGGKQVRVEKDQVIFVEKLDVQVGETYTFDKVLMVSGEQTLVGNPYVNATVTAVVEKQGRGEKIIVYKYRAKKNYHKKQGHRQPYTKLTIKDIVL